MGIEPFLVGTAVNLIQAQRLVRRVCSKCKQDVSRGALEDAHRHRLHARADRQLSGLQGQGLRRLQRHRVQGPGGLYEVMEISEGIRDLVMVGATAVELKRKALEEGMLTLRQSGLEKIRNGVTTVEEVLRETVL